MAGASPAAYWLATLLGDVIQYTFLPALGLAVAEALQLPKMLDGRDALLVGALLLWLYGVAALLVAYVLGRLFFSSAGGSTIGVMA